MKRIRCSGVLLALCALCMTGCGNPARTDQREEQDPMCKRARLKKQSQDIDGAIEIYMKALERKPHLARAHLELGLLYDGYKEDYVRALYHYERYLELRPKTEKMELIKDLVRRARISFAATLPETPSGAIEEIAELKRENSALKHRLSQVDGTMSAPTAHAPPPVRTTSRAASRAPSVPAPAPAQESVRTYRVQRGDTLSSIAAKMYSDSTQWKKIFEANQGDMKSPGNLRVGQTLIIPR